MSEHNISSTFIYFPTIKDRITRHKRQPHFRLQRQLGSEADSSMASWILNRLRRRLLRKHLK